MLFLLLFIIEVVLSYEEITNFSVKVYSKNEYLLSLKTEKQTFEMILYESEIFLQQETKDNFYSFHGNLVNSTDFVSLISHDKILYSLIFIHIFLPFLGQQLRLKEGKTCLYLYIYIWLSFNLLGPEPF